EFELVEIVVVDLVPAHRVVQRTGDVDPDRPIFLAEILRQVGPGHQVEPNEAHPTLPVQDRVAIIHWAVMLAQAAIREIVRGRLAPAYLPPPKIAPRARLHQRTNTSRWCRSRRSAHFLASRCARMTS